MGVLDKEIMTSLFTRKKPQDLYTSAVGTRAKVASSMVNPVYKAVNKAVSYGQSLFGNKAQAVNQSVAPKPQNMSMADNSRIDLSQQRRFQTPTPPPPPTTPPPAFSPQNTLNITNQRLDDYFKRMSDLTAQRIAREEQDRQKNADLLAQRYNLASEQIRGSIPNLRSAMDSYRANTEADIADTLKQGEMQKQQARDYAGEANRTAAQARNETQQQAMQKFAAQGAIDSAGAGSYRQANENIDSDFNRYVQQNSQKLANDLTNIDIAVRQYQRQAKTLIQNEEAKFNESIRQIEYQLADNEIAKTQAIEQVYQQYNDRINQIKDTLATIEQQGIEQKNNIALELEKLNTKSLSSEFMATGVPTNQTEYEYMVQNADKFKELGIFGSSQPELNASQENKVQLANSGLRALNEIEQIMARDPNIILKSSIPGQIGARDYSSAATRAVEGLLRARSGAAIPESEVRRYMQANLPRLGDSQEAINAKLSAFRRDLEEVASSGGATPQYSANQRVAISDPLGIL